MELINGKAVQFSECQNTIVQPDIIIMNMDVKETKEKSVVGTPSLVIEVLSDESRVKDGKLKLNQYGAQEKIPLDIWGENVVVEFFEVPKKVMVSKKNVKTKKEQRTKEPVNMEKEHLYWIKGLYHYLRLVVVGSSSKIW